MYSHVACDVMKERTLYLLKPSSLIWHLMPYLFLFKKAWAGGDNYSMVVKYSAGLKTLLQYGNSGPVFYGDLVLASSKV